MVMQLDVAGTANLEVLVHMKQHFSFLVGCASSWITAQAQKMLVAVHHVV